MTNPSWSDLVETTRSDELPHDHITAVLGRIGDTDDGKLLRAWLHDHKLMAVPKSGLSESALREDVAEKRLAKIFYNRLEPSFAPTKRIRRREQPGPG